ncbi:hypothetical protein FF38_04343 [Lucilia cuprina]|uniref:Uncharacterized protein n=1 Tax=Lucilia cuprina TaxID=7375 RepID=A0A0L0C7E2_LUCCU|nr:hypothetical protein CVS40_1564 [Lucilia cuprina]KNC28172.1 hypothetical protein FF38_04343 [Lucilia cuprina]
MDLKLNTERNRGLSLDDDNFSNISRISYGLHNSLNSACNSDSECSGPISVRDMIQHYNKQFQREDCNQSNHKIKYKINSAKRPHQSQHLLAATTSSYCGLNNYGSHIKSKQFTDQLENKSLMVFDEHNDPTAITCCKNCTACLCCQNRSRTNSTTNKMLSSNSLQANNENCGTNVSAGGVSLRSSSTKCNKINAKDTHILAVKNCTNINDVTTAADINASNSNKPTILNDFHSSAAELNKDSYSTNSNNGLFNKHNSQVVVMEQNKQKNRLLSTDSVEEAKICQQPTIETSYQSKTTIAKTSSGVRIIIDIFFDQERCSNNVNDIVGSRVETDIPQSRILSEFQRQTLAANENSNPKIVNTAESTTSYHGL